MSSDLERFVAAQDGVYEGALRELRAGRKTGHWIWFILPQLVGLGRSEMSRFYGIASLDEARDYLEHPVLGARLRECVRVVLGTVGTAEEVFGALDAMKVRSSMTLFERAAPDEPLFREMLELFYEGARDGATDSLLGIKSQPDLVPAPAWWDETASGEPMPNWEEVIRAQRSQH